MATITFLGTCGGRFATIYQTRSTGGIFIQDKLNISIDPGPGALLRMKQSGIDPTSIDLLLISHCHPDHYTDADVVVEAMTLGGTRQRGALLGSESVIAGIDGFDPKVSRYHVSHLENCYIAEPRKTFVIGGIKITATPTLHTDHSGVGFKIHTQHGTVTYTGDTSINEDIVALYKGTRVLILAVTAPRGISLAHHLSPDDAIEILRDVQPELALLTHFGLRAIEAGVEAMASDIQENSGVTTLAAWDGMSVKIKSEIEIPKNLAPAHD